MHFQTHAFLGGAYLSRFKMADGFYCLMALEGVLDSVIFQTDVYFSNEVTKHLHFLCLVDALPNQVHRGALAELSGQEVASEPSIVPGLSSTQ